MMQLRRFARPSSTLLLISAVLVGCGGGNGTITPTGPTTINLNSGQAAAAAIGQPDLTTGTVNTGGIGPNTANAPSGAADGSLYIAEQFNNRILGFTTPPAASNAAANFVLGQPDFVSSAPNAGEPSATFFHGPWDLCVSGGRLFMVSLFNSRVLIWNTLPVATGTAANIALGQPDLTSEAQTTTQTGLDLPEGICVAASKICVADANNDRIMIWTSIPGASGAAANFVLGRPDFTTNGAQLSQSGLDDPKGVWTDGTRVVVADTGNNRVLIWTSFPTANTQPADLVLGQAAFNTNGAGTGASQMNSPTGVCSNGTQLFVADANNNRVLFWNTFPTTNGQAADGVLGQAGFGTNAAATTATGMINPTKVKVVGTRLYVSDTLNNRTLVFLGN